MKILLYNPDNGVTRTGSYAAMFYALTLVVAALGACAWFVPLPRARA